MRHWKSIVTALLAGVMLAALAGCSSDSTAPQQQYEMDAATAEQWSAQTLEMISAMAATVPAVSQGDFTGVGAMAKSAEEPVWDEVEQAWVMDVTETITEGDPVHSSMEMSLYLWIQFRNAEGALPGPLGATEMEYRATTGMVMDSTEEGVTHLEMDYATGMTVTYLETGYGVDGAGEATVSASHTDARGSQSVDFSLAYGMDLMLPFEGCPSGPAWMTAGQYRTDAMYDGEGMVDWTLTGPNHSASGSDPVDCGASSVGPPQ
jgi:hypothetical protein